MTQDWKLTVTMKDYGNGSGDQGIMDALAARLAGKFSAQFFWYNGEKPAEFTHDGKGVITSTVFDAKIQNDLPDWWEDSFPADRDFEVVVNEENGEDEIRWQFAHGRCTSCVRGGEELVEQGGEDSTEFNIGGWCGQLYVTADAEPDENGKYDSFLAVTDSGLLLSGCSYWEPVYIRIPDEEQEDGSPDAYTRREIVEDYVIPYIKNGKKISLDQCAYYDEGEDVENFDVYEDFLNKASMESPGQLPFQQQFIAVAWMLENDTYGGIEPYHYDESDADNIDDGDFEIEDGILQSYSGSDSSISIPEDVTEIGEKAFSDCTSLASVTIPEGVTKIGREAFWGCTALASVTIPASVVTIASEAFAYRRSLAEIHFTGSKEQWALVGKGEDWNKDVPATVIHCTDGDELNKDSELVIEDGELKMYKGNAASITIPGSVTKIGGAFWRCTALTEIHFGGTQAQWFMAQGYMQVPENATIHCSDGDAVNPKTATEYVIPNGVTEIGKWAFSGCGSLTSVTIPEGVEKIYGDSYQGAFDGCKALASVTIPESLTEIGRKAFSDCTTIKEVRYGGTQAQWFMLKGYKLFPKDAVAHCSDGDAVNPETATEYIIPEGVTEIGYEAFAGYTSLVSVTIPKGVTKIRGDWNYGAFRGCTVLTSVSIPEGMAEIGENAFKDCTALAEIHFAGTKEQWAAVKKGNNWNLHLLAASVSCTDGDAEIPSFSIADGKLKKYLGFAPSATIPEGVTEISWEAFRGCTVLTSVSLPEGVKEIDGYAFEGCTSLASVTIPEGVTEIGKLAFSGCTSLASVSIPGSMTEIGDGAFEGCKSLKEVRFGGTRALWFMLNAFRYLPENVTIHCSDGDAKAITKDMTEYVIPEGVTAIGREAFSSCTALASMTIPEGVTKIGSSAFSGCTSLASVTIPDGVAEIGWSAFRGCTSLASVSISEGVTEIGERAFSGCTSLASVTIPASVTEIHSIAFYGCTSLASVSIPEGVMKIGERAFADCTSLSEIHYTGTKEQWAAVKKGDNWNKGVPAKEVLVRKE